MLRFCPTCANVLLVGPGPTGLLRFFCRTCPYIFNITKKMEIIHYPKQKEVDDILGGADAWENVDSTAERCPKCSHNRAFFMQMQTRSADEPMTTFYRCADFECSHQWRD